MGAAFCSDWARIGLGDSAPARYMSNSPAMSTASSSVAQRLSSFLRSKASSLDHFENFRFPKSALPSCFELGPGFGSDWARIGLGFGS